MSKLASSVICFRGRGQASGVIDVFTAKGYLDPSECSSSIRTSSSLPSPSQTSIQISPSSYVLSCSLSPSMLSSASGLVLEMAQEQSIRVGLTPSATCHYTSPARYSPASARSSLLSTRHNFFPTECNSSSSSLLILFASPRLLFSFYRFPRHTRKPTHILRPCQSSFS